MRALTICLLLTTLPSLGAEQLGNPAIWRVYSGDYIKENIVRVNGFAGLEQFKGADDVQYDKSRNALIVATKDRHIRMFEFGTKRATTLTKTPNSPAGIKLSPRDPNLLYFCSLKFFGDGVVYDKIEYDANDLPGVYELNILTGQVRPVLNFLPKASVELVNATTPVSTLNASTGRPFTVCNDLDISPDGKRLYMVESSQEPTENGPPAVKQIVLRSRHGKIWQLDLARNSLRLLGHHYSFSNGITLETDGHRETGVVFTEMANLRLMKIKLDSHLCAKWEETLIDGIPGLADGLSRDSKGRIHVALFKDLTPIILHLQAHPEELANLGTLPYHQLPVPKQTGLLILDPSGRKPLFFTIHDGSMMKEIPTISAEKKNVYLAPFADDSDGLYMIPNPLK